MAGDDKPPKTRQSQLWDEMEKAQREYFQAVSDQNAIIAEVPCGLPASDGDLRLANAGRARRIAFERYKEALQALNRFLNKHDPT